VWIVGVAGIGCEPRRINDIPPRPRAPGGCSSATPWPGTPATQRVTPAAAPGARGRDADHQFLRWPSFIEAPAADILDSPQCDASQTGLPCSKFPDVAKHDHDDDHAQAGRAGTGTPGRPETALSPSRRAARVRRLPARPRSGGYTLPAQRNDDRPPLPATRPLPRRPATSGHPIGPPSTVGCRECLD
jgi:hypothetical protein